jgi:hypothetical protein
VCMAITHLFPKVPKRREISHGALKGFLLGTLMTEKLNRESVSPVLGKRSLRYLPFHHGTAGKLAFARAQYESSGDAASLSRHSYHGTTVR